MTAKGKRAIEAAPPRRAPHDPLQPRPLPCPQRQSPRGHAPLYAAAAGRPAPPGGPPPAPPGGRPPPPNQGGCRGGGPPPANICASTAAGGTTCCTPFCAAICERVRGGEAVAPPSPIVEDRRGQKVA